MVTGASGLERLHPEAVGLRLYAHTRSGRLIAWDPVVFARGRAAVDTVLRRAAVAGRVEVEPFSGVQDYFADVLTGPWTSEQTVLLDRASHAILRTRWMRCRRSPED